MTEVHTFCHEAMATEFEVVIAQEGVDAMRAASISGSIFDEIDRLEETLSRFRPSSEIWRLRLLKAGESMVLDFATWDCLSLAKAVHQATSGAFDITLGPMMKLWRHPDGSPREATLEEIEAARQIMGMHLFDLDADSLRITMHADEMIFDLGAMGKGYALDQSLRLLDEHGITNALISAGESTIVAIGHAPDEDLGWPVALHIEPEQTLLLKGDALSCSGFAVQGNHIMNPRTLRPVPVQPIRSYVQAPTAALSDALSTAFLVMSPEEVAAFCASTPQVRAFGGVVSS